MIHDAVTPQLLRDWAGTDADVRYYEYEIRTSPLGSDDVVEAFVREATEHSAQRRELALTGEPFVVRSAGGNLLVLWKLAHDGEPSTK